VTSGRHARSVAAALLALALLLGAAAWSDGAARPLAGEGGAQARPLLAGIREHLDAFQEIAGRNGGNRLAGTEGYDASARYVARRMRAAGYRVRLQEFTFAFVADRSPPSLRPVDGGDWSFRADRDYATLGYSGSGRARAPVVAVDLLVPSPGENASTSGCETSDFAGFADGAIALLQRGSCTFREKIANAVAAGAVAAVVFNEGGPGRAGVFSGTLGSPQVEIPVLAASFAVGDALRRGARRGPTGIDVTLEAAVVSERRRTRNVLAESRSGRAGEVVMVGAHLDSVGAGPGINDNGSGSAVVLEAAETLAALRPRNRLRFAWWGAEEQGLLGSRRYVERLSAAARRQIALYLNFDMVGSPNFARFVYDGERAPAGSAAVERVLRRWFAARRLPLLETGIGASDHASFARAGIPVGGLFTGADGRKSRDEAADFGGRADRPYDPCYHARCDTIGNLSGTALIQAARAAVYALRVFARDTSAVRRAR